MPNLTDRFVGELDPPKRGYAIHWDGGHKKAVPGLGVRVTAAGCKAFIFNYRTSAGRLRRLTIGSPPTYTATLARDIANKHRRRIDAGGDPLADRQGERDAPTVADLAQLYIDTHAKSKRPVPRKTDEYTIEKEILPAMKHLKVADVKFGDVAKLHRRITERAPYRANRVLALLSTMFGIAVKQGWRADNPTRGVQRNLETPRERYLSGDELIRLSDA
jgi:Arm DNA-binding domain